MDLYGIIFMIWRVKKVRCRIGFNLYIEFFGRIKKKVIKSIYFKREKLGVFEREE